MESTQPTSGPDPPAPHPGMPSDLDDRARCGALIQELERVGFRILYALVGHRETAEDLLQETFARVWVSWKKYDPAKDKVAWIRQIARRVVIDHRRRNGAIKRGGSSRDASSGCPDENGRKVEDVSDALAENPGHAAIRRESENAMHEAAGGLDAADRELYALCIAGATVEEMIERTGRTKAAIETRLSRMRARLRVRLAGHDS